ncbi:hypothetical protein BAE44_0019337, partial [Dichanthelium oligosanthes]
LSKCVWALEQEEVLEPLFHVQFRGARDWLAEVMKSLPRESLTRVVITPWAIWQARRKAIHKNIFQSPLSIHRFIVGLSQAEANGEARTATGCPARWTPPASGFVKINVDAALSKNSSVSAAAAVARDETGMFLCASVIGERWC